MRILLALGGALALAGCVPTERVTLLAPAQEGKEIGSIAVEHGGIETLIDKANLQGRLRGERSPILRQLEQDDPAHTELMSGLPEAVVREVFKFASGQAELTGEQLQLLQTRMPGYLSRPEPQIEISAYTDVIGTEEANNGLSQRRASNVAEQLRGLGFEIDPDDVVARGEYAAQRSEKGQRGEEDENFRIVVVTVR